MALSGNYIHKTYSNHPTETETIKVTYPSDLPEDHIHYKFRGQTITETAQKTVVEEELYDNIYFIINTVTIYPGYRTRIDFPTDPDNWVVEAYYRVYESRDNRINDYENFLLDASEHFHNIDIEQNIFPQLYTKFKTISGLENLIDN